MTDTVNISQQQADMWAKERTLEYLLIETRGTNDILEKYVRHVMGDKATAVIKNSADKQIKATNDAADTNVKAAKDAADQGNQLTTRQEYAMKSLGQTFRNSLNDMAGLLNSANPGSVFNEFARNLDFLDNQFDGVESKLATFITYASYAADAFDKVYKVVSQINEVYLQSYSAGVRYHDSLSGLNEMVGASGMSMQQFTGIMLKYNQSFNTLGSKTVMKLNSEFKNLTSSGANLMMTQQESQEGLMSYIDILRLSGRLQRTSTSQIVTGANDYLKSINELSAASGRSREELLKSSKDALSQPEFQAFLRTLNDGAKANLEQGVTNLGAFGADIQTQFKNMIVAQSTGGTAAMYKANSSLYMLANQTGQMSRLLNVIELAKAGKDTTQAMIDLTAGIESSPMVQSGQLSRMARFNSNFAEMEKSFGALTIEADTLVQAQKLAGEELIRAAAEAGMTPEAYKRKQEEDSALFSKANAFMATQMTELGATFNELAIVAMPVVVAGMRALGGLLWAVNKPLELLAFTLGGLTDGIRSLIAMTGLSDDVAAPVAGVATASIVGAAGYYGLKGINSLRNNMGISAPGMLKGPNLPGLSSIGNLGEGLGKGLGGIGKGLGGLGRGVGEIISSVMEGIAKGFKAFGDPKVLLGIAGIAGLAGSVWIAGKAFQEFASVAWEDMAKAGVAIVALGFAAAAVGAPPVAAAVALGGAALGAAIAAIGAGLAGAAWLLGGTLPTLAEGIRAFTDIDGANLEKVGLGMIGIGGGLIAIGAGEVANAVGSFVGWIGSLFGAEDPIDRLKRFGELGEPLGKAGPALDAFGTAFLNATAKMNAATLNDSVETSMEQIMRILEMDASGTFGGEPPIIGQINSLADAMSNLSNASSDLLGVNGAVTTEIQTPGTLNSADLQKRTLAFYDNQKASNASIIELLQLANLKLEDLNSAVIEGADKTGRMYRRSGNRV